VRVVLWQRLGWYDFGGHSLEVGLVVWASLIGVVTAGTIAGSMLPFVLRSFRLDPATSSAPAVATLVDVAGLVIYFLVAKALLGGTLLP
jgi:magnesium transporter